MYTNFEAICRVKGMQCIDPRINFDEFKIFEYHTNNFMPLEKLIYVIENIISLNI